MKIFVGISENDNPRQLHSFFPDSEAMTHFLLSHSDPYTYRDSTARVGE